MQSQGQVGVSVNPHSTKYRSPRSQHIRSNRPSLLQLMHSKKLTFSKCNLLSHLINLVFFACFFVLDNILQFSVVPGPSWGSTTTVNLVFYVPLTRNYLNVKHVSISRQDIPKHKWIQVSIGLRYYPKNFFEAALQRVLYFFFFFVKNKFHQNLDF